MKCISRLHFLIWILVGECLGFGHALAYNSSDTAFVRITYSGALIDVDAVRSTKSVAINDFLKAAIPENGGTTCFTVSKKKDGILYTLVSVPMGRADVFVEALLSGYERLTAPWGDRVRRNFFFQAEEVEEPLVYLRVKLRYMAKFWFIDHIAKREFSTRRPVSLLSIVPILVDPRRPGKDFAERADLIMELLRKMSPERADELGQLSGREIVGITVEIAEPSLWSGYRKIVTLDSSLESTASEQ